MTRFRRAMLAAVAVVAAATGSGCVPRLPAGLFGKGAKVAEVAAVKPVAANPRLRAIEQGEFAKPPKFDTGALGRVPDPGVVGAVGRARLAQEALAQESARIEKVFTNAHLDLAEKAVGRKNWDGVRAALEQGAGIAKRSPELADAMRAVAAEAKVLADLAKLHEAVKAGKPVRSLADLTQHLDPADGAKVLDATRLDDLHPAIDGPWLKQLNAAEAEEAFAALGRYAPPEVVARVRADLAAKVRAAGDAEVAGRLDKLAVRDLRPVEPPPVPTAAVTPPPAVGPTPLAPEAAAGTRAAPGEKVTAGLPSLGTEVKAAAGEARQSAADAVGRAIDARAAAVRPALDRLRQGVDPVFGEGNEPEDLREARAAVRAELGRPLKLGETIRIAMLRAEGRSTADIVATFRATKPVKE